jgi:hypothetical protein
MRVVLLILLLAKASLSTAQEKPTRLPTSRWEASVGSGLFLDLFYANILGEYVGDPAGYPTKAGKTIQPGKMDRIEIKYHFNARSAISLYFQNAQWKGLLGSAIDPLAVWMDLKRVTRRWHFTMNYYRSFPSGKNGSWSIGSGFQVQIQKNSFPFYRVDDPANPTTITYIGAQPYWSYFEDWAIPLTVAHHWQINKNLKLGLMVNTAYTYGIGIENLAFLGHIAIPFGKPVANKRIKKKH